MEGFCPWIDPDDEGRIIRIFEILKKCCKDPTAFCKDHWTALEGMWITFRVACSS